jgi:hypothetical protein
MMLIDRAIAAYRVSFGSAGGLMVEHEFFGADRPIPQFRSRRGREGPEIQGLTVEEYINRLGQDLIPLAERCSRVMREAASAAQTDRRGAR